MCRALPRGPVLTAGAFVGEHQPTDADFLQWFVASANEAVRTGLPTGRGDGSCVPLELAHFIGDVAARALAMGTKLSGYDACPKGHCETVMVGRVPYYPLEEGPERATECFAEPPTKRKFVCRPSPVHGLASFHPVKDVIACDLVHGLYGSIMPRIMKLAKGKNGVLRQAKALCRCLPAEAPRQIPQAKLAAITRKDIRILSSDLYSGYLDEAQILLAGFLEWYQEACGMVLMPRHLLLHLATAVRRHGNLRQKRQTQCWSIKYEHQSRATTRVVLGKVEIFSYFEHFGSIAVKIKDPTNSGNPSICGRDAAGGNHLKPQSSQQGHLQIRIRMSLSVQLTCGTSVSALILGLI
ncbi:uncharacterized protein LOC125959307 [Anopheles darlingi]|uniref:uncharacterized protein LOC125959307 n=1 Tax=Anopheles darlingi TaxID=43151 RepID=UPI0020FFF71C|nr:uncharacterized protein LOC125959307 [Anopheles darlingi]